MPTAASPAGLAEVFGGCSAPLLLPGGLGRLQFGASVLQVSAGRMTRGSRQAGDSREGGREAIPAVQSLGAGATAAGEGGQLLQEAVPEGSLPPHGTPAGAVPL